MKPHLRKIADRWWWIWDSREDCRVYLQRKTTTKDVRPVTAGDTAVGAYNKWREYHERNPRPGAFLRA